MINQWSDDEVGDIVSAVPKAMGSLRDAVKFAESRGNPLAVSPKGAEGTMQVMPKTQADPGFGVAPARDKSPAELERVGNDYLDAMLRTYKSIPDALAAYNWGPGNFDKYVAGGRKGSMPEETVKYIKNVMGFHANPETMKRAPMATGTQNQWSDDEIGGPPAWSDADIAPAPKKKSAALPMSREETVKKASEMALEGIGWDGRALTGLGKVFADMGRGVSGIFGAKPDEDDAIRDKALTDTSGGFWGNLLGEAAVTAAPATGAFKVATAVPRLANMTGKAGTVARLTAGGAAGGAVSESMLNRDPVTGAILGATATPLFAGAGKLASNAVKAGQRFVAGTEGAVTEKLRNIFGDRTDAAINALRNTGAIVPGEQPTVIRAATPELPEFAVLDRQGRNSPAASRFTQRDAETKAARLNALEGGAPGGVRPVDPVTGKVGESPVESLRSGATRPLYDRAMRDIVTVPRDLERVLVGPEVRPAVNDALAEFSQAVRNAQQAGTTVPRAGRTGPFREFPELSVDQLQRIVKQLDMRIASSPTFELKQARRAISDAIKEQSPDYRTATTLFAEMSKPQNQADTMQVLTDKLASPMSDELQRLPAFMAALRDAPQTVKKADLSPRFQNFEQVFQGNRAGLDALRNVGKSVEREARTNAFSSNKSILPELPNIFTAAVETTPGMLTRAVTVLRSGLTTLARRSDRDVTRMIQEAAADPQRMAELISALPPGERVQFINIIRQASGKVPSLMSGPLTVGAEKTQE